jgi:hypothetical protein
MRCPFTFRSGKAHSQRGYPFWSANGRVGRDVVSPEKVMDLFRRPYGDAFRVMVHGDRRDGDPDTVMGTIDEPLYRQIIRCRHDPGVDRAEPPVEPGEPFPPITVAASAGPSLVAGKKKVERSAVWSTWKWVRTMTSHHQPQAPSPKTPSQRRTHIDKGFRAARRHEIRDTPSRYGEMAVPVPRQEAS